MIKDVREYCDEADISSELIEDLNELSSYLR